MNKLPTGPLTRILTYKLNGIKSFSQAKEVANDFNKSVNGVLSPTELEMAIIDGLGFIPMKNIASPVLYNRGLFEIGYFSEKFAFTHYWSYFLIQEMTNNAKFYNDKGKLIKEIDSAEFLISANYFVSTFKVSNNSDTSKCEIYTSKNGDIVKLIDFILPLGYMLNASSESYDGLIIFLYSPGADNRIRIFKYEKNEIKELFKNKKFFKNRSSPYSGKTNPENNFFGGGYNGLYTSEFFYSYDETKILDTFIHYKYAGGEDAVVYLKENDVIRCDNNLGLDVMSFTRDVAREKEGILEVIWSSETLEDNFTTFNSLVFDANRVRDLITGEVIIDLSNIEYYDSGYDLIKGITLKSDGTGYNIWVDEEYLKYNLKEEIIKLRPDNILRDALILPEREIEVVGDTKEEVIDNYYEIDYYYVRHAFSENYFIVLSIHSLFPYYYFKATGKFICVMAYLTPVIFYIIGYNHTGHRVFSKYTDAIHNNITFLLHISDTEDIIYNWITKFLGNSDYVMGSKTDKIMMIDSYFKN